MTHSFPDTRQTEPDVPGLACDSPVPKPYADAIRPWCPESKSCQGQAARTNYFAYRFVLSLSPPVPELWKQVLHEVVPALLAHHDDSLKQSMEIRLGNRQLRHLLTNCIQSSDKHPAGSQISFLRRKNSLRRA